MTATNARTPVRAPREGESLADYFKAHGTEPATLAIIGQLVDCLFDHLRAVNEKNVERNDKISALETKVRELEARPVGLKYLGVWQPATEYMQDDGVTADGSVWVCRLNHVRSQPGVDHCRGSWPSRKVETAATRRARDD